MPPSPPNSKLANMIYQVTTNVLVAHFQAVQSPDDADKQTAFTTAQTAFNNAVAAINTELANTTD